MRAHPTLRGFLIIGAIAAVIVALQLQATLAALYLIAKIAFLLAIAFFCFLLGASIAATSTRGRGGLAWRSTAAQR